MYILKLLVLSCVTLTSGTDYYETLSVSKMATTQEIRKAFKKLAITLHPDKNKDDPDAHDKFIKLTRAYEVLKDDEKRKHYDIHGEDTGGGGGGKPQYHSYTYYRDQFGIYDDDPQIVTLSHTEFETNVDGSEVQWFINFYSPYCSHCHDLAPTWRKLAQELKGVLMFGAVNCEEDWTLCRELGIATYPSLVLYPSRERFHGDRYLSELRDFVLERVKSDLVFVGTQGLWEEEKERYSNWLLILQSNRVIETDTTVMAAMLKGLLGVAAINCDSVACEDLRDDPTKSLVYLEKVHGVWTTTSLQSDNPQEVMTEVLDLLPSVPELDTEAFRMMMETLQDEDTEPWLIYFHLGRGTGGEHETKKLSALLPNFRIGSIHCGRSVEICSEISISRYPEYGVFKAGGGAREFHHGENSAASVASFARQSAQATNLRTLNMFDFETTINSGAWFVDFYAPWCPPCMKLLPQLRKASLSFSPQVVGFATVDCTIHDSICRAHNIRSYPTTVLFNATTGSQNKFMGGHTAASIVDFVTDIISPQVISLTEETFYTLVGRKNQDDIWMVDFFMPWCGPCQQLAPQYRKLAKMVEDMPKIHIGEVNCELETELCHQQGIRSYPHIRLYPMDSEGLGTVALYSGYQRDAKSLRRWLFSFLSSSVTELTPQNFRQVTESEKPWLVDFYAPWCGHCVAFEPEFIMLSQKLEAKDVLTGKVNCELHYSLCQSAGVTGYPTLVYYRPNNRNYRGIEIQSQNPATILQYVERMASKSRPKDEL